MIIFSMAFVVFVLSYRIKKLEDKDKSPAQLKKEKENIEMQNKMLWKYLWIMFIIILAIVLLGFGIAMIFNQSSPNLTP